MLNWFRKNKKSNAEISVPELLKVNKINFNIQEIELIGQEAILTPDDLYNCKFLLHKKRISEIRKLNTFNGKYDCILFYLARDEDSKELLIGVLDPVELYQNPYLLDYSFISL